MNDELRQKLLEAIQEDMESKMEPQERDKMHKDASYVERTMSEAFEDIRPNVELSIAMGVPALSIARAAFFTGAAAYRDKLEERMTQAEGEPEPPKPFEDDEQGSLWEPEE